MNHTIFAYIDPGTGSYLFQVVLAGLFGAGYAVRMFWSRIKSAFGRSSPASRTDDSDN